MPDLVRKHSLVLLAMLVCFVRQPLTSNADESRPKVSTPGSSIVTEKLAGIGVWKDPRFLRLRANTKSFRITVWFEEQLLGDGAAYNRRAKEFSKWTRRELRTKVVETLKNASNKSWAAAKARIDELTKAKTIRNVERHWIVNAFSCETSRDGLKAIDSIPGVRKVFLAGGARRPIPQFPPMVAQQRLPAQRFDPKRYLHPWYINQLMVDRVWNELKVTGQGTLNVVSDGNFIFNPNVIRSVYRNPAEVPDNGKDDDGNGLIDDVHGFDFERNVNRVNYITPDPKTFNPQAMHGFMCAAIICGQGAEDAKHEFGIAPEGSWAGVIAATHLEASVEWSVSQRADTYSMSFSIPGLGDYRSHWRKVMEHGSFCGICFVSGAGNFAQSARLPFQMRTPEDIPNAIFAAAGVQRDLSRTVFSSQGPVEWKTEHYNEGRVNKPEVCAFNSGLPAILSNGDVLQSGLNGNSFAGPMFGGAIALMLSADPDLLPWDLREIITTTATDVGPEGIDAQTGHGLINCYRAVKEVLRRKAVRDGKDASKFTGRVPGDELDVVAFQKELTKNTKIKVLRIQPGGQAQKLGMKVGDVIVSYNGRKIANRSDLIAARVAASKKKAMISVEIKRADKTLTLKFKPGQIGFVPIEDSGRPTFQ
jgi:hypothetical protein